MAFYTGMVSFVGVIKVGTYSQALIFTIFVEFEQSLNTGQTASLLRTGGTVTVTDCTFFIGSQIFAFDTGVAGYRGGGTS